MNLYLISLAIASALAYPNLPDGPAPFEEFPWYEYLFEYAGVAASDPFDPKPMVSVGVPEIRRQIQSRFGLMPDTPIRIKVRAGEGLAIANGDTRIKFNTLSQIHTQPRYIVRGQGTIENSAKARYVWPSVDQEEIMGAVNDTRIICTAEPLRNSGVSALFYLDIVWQSGLV